MSKQPTTKVTRSAIGGAANESGGFFRASVAAWIVAHGLVGRAISGLSPSGSSGVPKSVSLETSDPLDDIRIDFTDGSVCMVQAKLSLSLSNSDRQFAAVVSQWRTAVRRLAAEPRRVSLVAITARASAAVNRLSRALDRLGRPIAGPLTDAEEIALRQLRDRGGLEGEQFEQLCGLIRVVVVAVEGPVSLGSVGTELLDGQVVAQGRGVEAWRVLMEEVRARARGRAGGDMAEWANALRQAGLPLIADIAGTVSAQSEARRDALDRYRRVVRDKAARMDLRGLGTSLPQVPYPTSVLNTRVDAGSGTNDEHREIRISTALRRRGRCILTGPPGSGKSTALAVAAAEWAAHDGWPLPLVVRLDVFERLAATTRPMDALLEAALADVPDGADVALRLALKEEIARSNIAVFADGLDETRHKRFRVVQLLEGIVQNELSGISEFVLSTRGSAYAAASTLPFVPIKILPPRDPIELAADLLQSIGIVTGASEKDSDWLRSRRAWVSSMIDREPTLGETPLMPVLLVVLACERGVAKLPEFRAAILSEIVNDVVRRWEVQQRRVGDIGIGVLQGEAAISALHRSFEVVGWELLKSREPLRRDIERRLAEVVAGEWVLTPRQATATAKDLLHFWDEAGIYVFAASADTITSRITLVGELGAALFIANLQGEALERAVESALADGTANIALGLAMELRSTAATMVAQQVARRGEITDLLWCAAQIRSGAVVETAAIQAIGEALLGAASSTSSWEVLEALCILPIQDDRWALQVEATLESRPHNYRVVAMALLQVTRGRAIAEPRAVLDSMSDELSRDAFGLKQSWAVAPHSAVLVDFARTLSRQLIAASADNAAAIRQMASHFGMRDADSIKAALRDAGVPEEADPDEARSVEKMARGIQLGSQRMREDWRWLLKQVAAFRSPSELTALQRRRLDELADFCDSVRYRGSIPRSITEAIRGEPSLPWLLSLAALLSGFDAGVLAGEATEAMALPDGLDDSMALAFDSPTARPLAQWGNVPQSQHSDTAARLADMVGGHEWPSWIASAALDEYPDADVVADLMHARLVALPGRRRLRAARLIAGRPSARWEVCRHEWPLSRDPVLRGVAAQVLVQERSPCDLEWAFTDADATVRESALKALQLRDEASGFRELIEKSIAVEPSGWFCLWCDRVTNLGRSCDQCRNSGPDVLSTAGRMLKELARA